MSTTIKSKDGGMICGAIDVSTGEPLDIKYDSKNNKFISKRRNWFQRFFIDSRPETEVRYLGIFKFPSCLDQTKVPVSVYGKYLKFSNKPIEIYFDYSYEYKYDNSVEWTTITKRYFCNIDAYLQNGKIIYN